MRRLAFPLVPLLPRLCLAGVMATGVIPAHAARAQDAASAVIAEDKSILASRERELRDALWSLEAKLSSARDKEKWLAYLRLPDLRRELGQRAPSEATLRQILARFHEPQEALAWAPVGAVRQALDRWLAARFVTSMDQAVRGLAAGDAGYRPIFAAEAQDADRRARERLRAWLASGLTASPPASGGKGETGDESAKLTQAFRRAVGDVTRESWPALLEALDASAWLYDGQKADEKIALWRGLHEAVAKGVAAQDRSRDQERFGESVRTLTKAWRALRDDPSSSASLAWEAPLRFLRTTDRAEGFIDAVDRFQRWPNFSLALGESLFRDLFGGDSRLSPSDAQVQVYSPTLAITSRTTARHMTVAARQASPFQLAAPAPTPALRPQGDIAVRVHQSSVNNLFHAYRGQSTWAALIGKGLLGVMQKGFDPMFSPSLPDLTAADETRQVLVLARSYPITIRFSGNEFEAKIAVDDIVTPNNRYKARDIYVSYRLANEDGQRILQQVRPVDVFPRGIRSEEGMSFADKMVRGAVRQEFHKFLQPSIPVEALLSQWDAFKGKDVSLRAAAMTGGWLVLDLGIEAKNAGK